MNYEKKLHEVCAIKFAERDLSFEKSITGAFQEMNARGMLHSGATVAKVGEVSGEEIQTSTEVILTTSRELQEAYFQKICGNEFKNLTLSLLKRRIETIQNIKKDRLDKILRSLMNERIHEAVNLKELVAKVELDAEIEIDKFLIEVENKKGTTLKDKTMNSFNNHPFIVIVVVVFSALILLSNSIDAIKSLTK